MSEITRRAFVGAAGSLAGASILGASGVVGASIPIEREVAEARGAARKPSTAGSQEPALTLAITEYLRFTPLAAGWVQGTDLTVRLVRGTRREMLDRTVGDPTVDGGEGSMLGQLLRIARGDRSMVAVPVFLLRNFTARDLYTLQGSPLTPRGLDGHRLGIYNWAASGATWYRHLLRWLGNEPTSIQWVVGGTDTAAPVTPLVPLPPHVRNAPPDRSLSALLQEGEIEAFFAPLPPAAHHPEHGPLVRLIPEFSTLEKRYFRETGIYPPQHVLLMKREAWERNPGAGRGLLEIFQECERQFTAGQRLYPYESPWMIREVEETELLMGLEYHTHGLDANRAALDGFCTEAFRDGLTPHRVSVDEYFEEFLRAE